MAGRGRCWVCGLLLEATATGRICRACLAESQGMCSRCEDREECGASFRATTTRRRREGLGPPLYPPCTHRGEAPAPRWLCLTQQRVYGADLSGVGAVLVAESNATAYASVRGDTALRSYVAEIARRWGGIWVVPCDGCGRIVHLVPKSRGPTVLCTRCDPQQTEMKTKTNGEREAA